MAKLFRCGIASNSKKLIILDFINGNGFKEGFGLGNTGGWSASSTTGFSMSATSLYSQTPTNASGAGNGNFINGKIDGSKYTTLYCTFIQGGYSFTDSADLSSITSNGYIGINYLVTGDKKYIFSISFCSTNTGNVGTTSIANYRHTYTSNPGTIGITKIWLE